MWLTLWRKTVFVNICPLLLVCSKKLFKQIQNFLRICPFSNIVRRKKLAEYFSARFSDSHFYVKWKVHYEFTPKHFKTTGRHILAVCGSPCGENQFLLIIIPFYRFDQKQFFKQIQISLTICPFQTW